MSQLRSDVTVCIQPPLILRLSWGEAGVLSVGLPTGIGSPLWSMRRLAVQQIILCDSVFKISKCQTRSTDDSQATWVLHPLICVFSCRF